MSRSIHLVTDTVRRLPQAGDNGITRKQPLKNQMIAYKRGIDMNGEDLPEIRNWKEEVLRPLPDRPSETRSPRT